MFVTFIINETGKVVERFIPSYYKAKSLVHKLKYSKKCTLISWSKS